ncbi:MAG: TetR/AcrR family transcriptional regulator [Acidimicrobiia bacterium]|nr:TetR/AcrR family transcriptional regulator [Acidimicrobiia bacterium]
MTTTEGDTRERLLRVGADLFNELGYAETSLRTLADRAGVKAGSIYYHFESKDVLLTEILRIGMERMAAAYDQAMAAARQRPGREQIRAAIRAHLNALFTHGPFTTAHVAVFNRAPVDVRAEIVPLRDDYESRWFTLYETLAATGDIRSDVDLHLARLTLLGSMNSAIEWFDPDGDESLDALVDEIARLHWGGIRIIADQEDD